MQPNNQNSYDFIMNPDQKRSLGPISGGPQKILMILGLFTGVIILIILLFSIVSGGGNSNRDNLISVSANQTELIRILEDGIGDVESPDLQQRFQTLLTATNSDAQEVTALITSRGIEITALQKNALKDESVDEDLETALQRRDFDTAFEAAISQAAGSYFQALQTAANSAATTAEKDTLNQAIFNLQTIAD